MKNLIGIVACLLLVGCGSAGLNQPDVDSDPGTDDATLAASCEPNLHVYGEQLCEIGPDKVQAGERGWYLEGFPGGVEYSCQTALTHVVGFLNPTLVNDYAQQRKLYFTECGYGAIECRRQVITDGVLRL